MKAGYYWVQMTPESKPEVRYFARGEAGRVVWPIIVIEQISEPRGRRCAGSVDSAPCKVWLWSGWSNSIRCAVCAVSERRRVAREASRKNAAKRKRGGGGE